MKNNQSRQITFLLSITNAVKTSCRSKIRSEREVLNGGTKKAAEKKIYQSYLAHVFIAVYSKAGHIYGITMIICLNISS